MLVELCCVQLFYCLRFSSLPLHGNGTSRAAHKYIMKFLLELDKSTDCAVLTSDLLHQLVKPLDLAEARSKLQNILLLLPCLVAIICQMGCG